jgi:Flp pilus assembly protein TadB
MTRESDQARDARRYFVACGVISLLSASVLALVSFDYALPVAIAGVIGLCIALWLDVKRRRQERH